MPQELIIPGTQSSLDLMLLLINLGVGVVLAVILRWHFARYGSTLSNREEFAQVFPFILLTTILIITVVKSSLALSLGLVGALSIVRFRTPIKESEELAYIKKPEYGPGKITAQDIVLDGLSIQARAQKNSLITIDGAPVPTEDVDVAELYKTVMKKGLR
jgi:hypothetical protein